MRYSGIFLHADRSFAEYAVARERTDLKPGLSFEEAALFPGRITALQAFRKPALTFRKEPDPVPGAESTYALQLAKPFVQK
jgi:hypothetical protein